MLLLFFCLLAARTGVSLLLDALQTRRIRAQAAGPAPAQAGLTDPDTHARSVAYALARHRLASLRLVFDAAILAALLATGALASLWGGLSGLLGTGLFGQAAVFFSTLIVLHILGLPFDLWETFRLEEKFGFNRTTPKLWLTDLFKGLAMAAALGLPLLTALLAIVEHVATWWLWGAILLFTFQLLVAFLYPTLIMPLFNKLTPLPEGELRDRLLALAAQTGFTARAILVMDGSTRSQHANAFFAGFGRARRIVLYDTLIQQLDTEELAAVLAHEIGHYRLGHLPRRLVVGALFTLAVFGALGWLATQPAFLTAFGFTPDAGAGPFLMLAFLTGGLVTFWLDPLSNGWSRKHEFEADAYAARILGAASPLVGALRKLHRKNLSLLSPHPVWAAFHASHPSLPEREERLALGQAAGS